ncbi:dihydrofolate reductase family protein [Streptomyces sp. NPDC059850]|uniref:dihydrofolate reductase family protein n=1 Tax=Streptomyces sp. NPDC059850 TaxID=3346970 RepID=UPI003667D3E6
MRPAGESESPATPPPPTGPQRAPRAGQHRADAHRPGIADCCGSRGRPRRGRGTEGSAGLVDRVIAYIAPALLGRGKSALQGGTIETMDDILRCELLNVSRFGPDARLIARPKRPQASE